MNTLVIACNTIADEIKLAMEEVGCSYPVIWIESGLHLQPDLLRIRLQEELDRTTGVDQVLMIFGYCGNSLVGLSPPSFQMIFPDVDDCISLLLGSCDRRKEVSSEMGTYFLTKGWLDNEKNIWAEYQQTEKKYGKERTERIFKIMLAHYRRLGMIETGAYDLTDIEETTRHIADVLNLKYQAIPGTVEYIKKLLTGPWDDGFVIINAGETVTIDRL
ncbi:MAG: DUF1638 domain-containing protein, partial [Bacillota bacterium]